MPYEITTWEQITDHKKLFMSDIQPNMRVTFYHNRKKTELTATDFENIKLSSDKKYIAHRLDSYNYDKNHQSKHCIFYDTQNQNQAMMLYITNEATVNLCNLSNMKVTRIYIGEKITHIQVASNYKKNQHRFLVLSFDKNIDCYSFVTEIQYTPNLFKTVFPEKYLNKTCEKLDKTILPKLRNMSSVTLQEFQHLLPKSDLEINKLFREIATELTLHLQKEEEVLFPYVKQLLQDHRDGVKPSMSNLGEVNNPIKEMENEHESAGDIFKTISKISNKFTPPEEACNTFRALYSKLEEFEQDLHQHIHLENNILFPKSIKLENQFK